jgi:hypothetical protein
MIDLLLRAALPAEVHALVPRLVGEVAAREFVAARVQKRWGELTEGEGNPNRAGGRTRSARRAQRRPHRVEQSPALAVGQLYKLR